MVGRSPQFENFSLAQAESSPNSPFLTCRKMKRDRLEIQGDWTVADAWSPAGADPAAARRCPAGTARPRSPRAAAGVSSLVGSALQRQQRALRPGKKRGASGRKQTGSGGSGMSWELVECPDPGPRRLQRWLGRERSGHRVQSRAPWAWVGLAEEKGSRHSSAR